MDDTLERPSQTSTNSVTSVDSTNYTPEMIDHLTAADARLLFTDLDLEDRLELILGEWDLEAWTKPEALDVLAALWVIPQIRFRIEARCRKLSGNVKLLTVMIDSWLATFTPPSDQAATANARPESPLTCWDAVTPIGEFLAQEELPITMAARDLVMPGGLTLVAAPRGTGKSTIFDALAVALAAGGVFRDEQVQQCRVLLVDRDNPTRLVRERLRKLGARAGDTLDIMGREKAPPLSDRPAWRAFPVERYDVVFIDSLGASTEGISEKEGRQTQEYLATLKDLTGRGVAVVCLDNTNKAAQNIRGRGEKSDAADILYELRDITGWTPASGGCWWESLPEYGEHAWQAKTSRRQGQTSIKVAFFCTKFRLGADPAPFALDIDMTSTPWGLRDMTAELETAGEHAAHESRRLERTKLEKAAGALYAVLPHDPAPPMLKRAAEDFLVQQGLTWKQARTVLADGFNADLHAEGLWSLREIPGAHGSPIGVYPVGVGSGVQKIDVQKNASNNGVSSAALLYEGSTACVQKTAHFSTSNSNDYSETSFVRVATSGHTKEVERSPAILQDENDVGIFCTPTPTSADRPSASPECLPQAMPPCVQCGGTDRWLDGEVWRCSTCWPRGKVSS